MPFQQELSPQICAEKARRQKLWNQRGLRMGSLSYGGPSVAGCPLIAFGVIHGRRQESVAHRGLRGWDPSVHRFGLRVERVCQARRRPKRMGIQRSPIHIQYCHLVLSG